MNYLVLAMKRSGHHVIINWLKAFTGLKHYNNVCFGWEDKKLLTMKGKKEAKEGIANIEDFNMDDWEKFDFPSFPFLKNCKVIVVVRSSDNWLASCYQRKFQNNEEWKDVYKYLNKKYINDSKRKSPSRIELYCKYLERMEERVKKQCWAIKRCSVESKQNCPAWEFQIGHLCWFINGTICRGGLSIPP